MNNLENVDIGSKILSISIAIGFFAFILLIIRTIVLGIKSMLSNMSLNNDEETTKITDKSKGF